MKRLHEKGEVATILAISAIVVIGISMISSAFLGGKKQSTSSKAEGNCTRAFRQSCPDGETLSEDANGAQVCCKQEVQTIIPTAIPPTKIPVGSGPIPDDKVPSSTPATSQPTAAPTSANSICPGGNQACSSNCGSGNDCVKYLESVSVPGLSDGSVITTDSFSCDIVTKNVSGVRTDTDNICGVKVNDQWPAWCPWDGVGQYMCGATITSRANCDLKSSHFSSTPVKAGDKLQVVAARKTGSCGNIPWNTGGSFITGPTFYYKQKGGGSTNTTPQATTAPQTPRATTVPQQPQPTIPSQATTTTAPTGTVGGCQDFGNYCVSECSQVHAGWSCMGEKNNYCCPNVNSITPTTTVTSIPSVTQPLTSLSPTSFLSLTNPNGLIGNTCTNTTCDAVCNQKYNVKSLKGSKTISYNGLIPALYTYYNGSQKCSDISNKIDDIKIGCGCTSNKNFTTVKVINGCNVPLMIDKFSYNTFLTIDTYYTNIGTVLDQSKYLTQGVYEACPESGAAWVKYRSTRTAGTDKYLAFPWNCNGTSEVTIGGVGNCPSI